MIRAAADMLTVLPRPGETVHILWTARADLMHGLVALIEQIGTVDALRIATLCYNGKNLAELLRLLDSGQVKTLTLLASNFFRSHNPELWSSTVEEFRARGQRAAAARSHCKVVTLAFQSGRRLSIEGSANTRANGNLENLAVTEDAGLHEWHSGWIDELVGRHEGEADHD
jgi:hypothetical protein